MTKKCDRCKSVKFMEQYKGLTCVDVFGERDIDCLLNWSLNVGTKNEKILECRCFSENEINKVREDPCTCVKDNNVWLTISPKQNTDFSSFNKIIEKFFKSKTIAAKSWYCFEWRHNGSDNDGLHVHCFIKPQNLRRLRWHYKGLMKRKKDWIFKCYDPCIFDEDDKLSYCKGETFNDDKSEKKKMDISKRKKYNIDNIIYK